MPPRHTPRTLAEYPWVVVRIACSMCKRKKAFSLARLAAKYGPEQSLDGLLRDVAHTCPWYNEAARKYEPRCGAGFVDLERNLLPADHPDEPIYRQRQPAREDLPKPPKTAKPPKSPGMRPLPATPLPSSNVIPMPVRPEPVRPPPMPVIVAAVPRLAHWPAPEIVFACAGCEIRQAHIPGRPGLRTRQPLIANGDA